MQHRTVSELVRLVASVSRSSAVWVSKSNWPATPNGIPDDVAPQFISPRFIAVSRALLSAENQLAQTASRIQRYRVPPGEETVDATAAVVTALGTFGVVVILACPSPARELAVRDRVRRRLVELGSGAADELARDLQVVRGSGAFIKNRHQSRHVVVDEAHLFGSLDHNAVWGRHNPPSVVLVGRAGLPSPDRGWCLVRTVDEVRDGLAQWLPNMDVHVATRLEPAVGCVYWAIERGEATADAKRVSELVRGWSLAAVERVTFVDLAYRRTRPVTSQQHAVLVVDVSIGARFRLEDWAVLLGYAVERDVNQLLVLDPVGMCTSAQLAQWVSAASSMPPTLTTPNIPDPEMFHHVHM